MKTKYFFLAIILLTSLLLNAQIKVLSDGKTLMWNSGTPTTFGQLNIKAATNVSGIWIEDNATQDWTGTMTAQVHRVNTMSYGVRYNGVDKFYVNGNGQVYAAGVWLGSDSKLKNNINTISNALNKVVLLRGVTYNLNSETENKAEFSNPKLYMGVVAQEVEKVVPEVVKDMHDGTKAVSYLSMVGLLIESTKDLKKIVDEQSAKIEKLESSIATSSVNNDNTTQTKAKLEQNTPNPFTQRTEIQYSIPENYSKASINVYNLNGIQIKSFNINQKGIGSIVINGNELIAGIYIYNLIIDGKEIDSKRMVLTN